MARAWAGIIAVLTAGALAATATAGRSTQWSEHVLGVDDIEDFCGVQDLNVHHTYSIDIAFHIVPQGRDGLEYWNVRGRYAESFTSNGRTATSTANVLEKDLKVEDNGDGSLTIVELATGNATLYGPDGKAIARNPGQLRYLLYIAPDGTLTRGDVVKGSTGRSDDFCDALVQALS